jgi:hypothetical protein
MTSCDNGRRPIETEEYKIPISEIISLRNSSKTEIEEYLKTKPYEYKGYKSQGDQTCHIWGYLSPEGSIMPVAARIDLCESGLSYLITDNSYFWKCISDMENNGFMLISERRKPDLSFVKYFKDTTRNIGVVVWVRDEVKESVKVTGHSFFFMDTIGVNNLVNAQWP